MGSGFHGVKTVSASAGRYQECDAVTDSLREWSDGDAAALKKLIPLVHAELRRLAHRYMHRETCCSASASGGTHEAVASVSSRDSSSRARRRSSLDVDRRAN
jgi:hypothetical protein